MGPNVVNLAERRKSKPVKPTVLELATFVCDDILDHWNKASSKNKLNEYFMVCTPPYSHAGINYLEDLTAIAEMERRIGLWVQIISPNFGEPGIPGWVAAFRVGSTTVATPFLTSETFVRCFNILLYLRLQRDLKSFDV
jgi:hypothetical protein